MKTMTRRLPSGFASDLRAVLKEKLVYVSAAIRKVTIDKGDWLHVTFDGIPADVESKIDRFIDRFSESTGGPPTRILHEEAGCPGRLSGEITRALIERGEMIELGQGQFALTGMALELLEFFDRRVKEIGQSLGAREHRYPTLIPIAAMQRVQYLTSRPECLNFVSHLREDIDLIDSFAEEAKEVADRVELGGRVETDCVNAVAVCLHAFNQLQGQNLGSEPKYISAVGTCMRFESRNVHSLCRLRDFTMREIVCVGTAEDVRAFRRSGLQAVKETLAEWGLESVIATSNDPFFTREFAGQAAFQKAFGLKYEFRARLASKKESLAIGSLNNHRDFIGKGFSILAGGIPAHSSCLAYGLERCVFSFFTQHGMERSNWPDAVNRQLSPSTVPLRVQSGRGL